MTTKIPPLKSLPRPAWGLGGCGFAFEWHRAPSFAEASEGEAGHRELTLSEAKACTEQREVGG